MWETVLESIVANGAWAVLFCLLLVYELKDSRNREAKYQQTVASLLDALQGIDEIRDDLGEIKKAVCPVRVTRERTTVRDVHADDADNAA